MESEGKLLRERIIAECTRNLSELDSVIIRNEEVFSYFDSLSAIKDLELPSLNVSIANELLTKSAWSFTKSSRSFSYMDEAFLSQAAVLYERQDYYMSISNQMFEKLGDMLMADPDVEKIVGMIHYYLSNLNSSAVELKSTYESFLAEYN